MESVCLFNSSSFFGLDGMWYWQIGRNRIHLVNPIGRYVYLVHSQSHKSKGGHFPDNIFPSQLQTRPEAERRIYISFPGRHSWEDDRISEGGKGDRLNLSSSHFDALLDYSVGLKKSEGGFDPIAQFLVATPSKGQKMRKIRFIKSFTKKQILIGFPKFLHLYIQVVFFASYSI